MEPPSEICRKLAEVHPQARIGWDGELGKYALIQLYHQKDAATTLKEPWNARGPIYGKNGKPAPDWDHFSRVPIYLLELSPSDVHSGKIVEIVKRWMRPIATRMRETAIEKGKEVEQKAQEMSDGIASKIYRDGQRDGAGAPIVAKKFVELSKNSLRYHAGELDFTEKLLPPAPPGGWKKHLDQDSKMEKGLSDESGSDAR
jgi:hypothetical protein